MRPLLRILVQAAALVCLGCSSCEARSPETTFHGPHAIALALQQTGRVTDAADIIPPDIEERLSTKLDELERETLHQMVIVTVATLSGHDVAEVADQIGNTWHIGRARQADGVVLLVAPNERRVRISVADGIRQKLPNEVCQEIIDQAMLPRFRAGDMPGAIEAGTAALIAHLA